VQNKIEQGGVIKRMLKAGDSDDAIIEKLYLRCFARGPTPEEGQKLKAFVTDDSSREQILGDIFWSLLNAKEFVFNH
jgi:hypothetical protein